MDREFSYQGLLEALVEEGMSFVICLNRGNRAAILDEEGGQLGLLLAPGEKGFGRGVLPAEGEGKSGWGMAEGIGEAPMGDEQLGAGGSPGYLPLPDED